ncbi:fibrous sheath CABYR-binding protein-like [Simochromis diagramma]|uniref:fibrous sheath CABYR-binding protein-like n=1 Tax=Simochromis diagramma TaxID=43689 RepID=UPI001A7E60A1|nr:fibrous sheath CABYR-binding protein-like [Simochromis diagramma]
MRFGSSFPHIPTVCQPDRDRMIPPTTMDPANSGVATEERSLAQLWDYCRSVIQAVDPHKRLIQVVFFDNYLSSTTLTMNFLDINNLKPLVTSLRESSSFELFGLGSPSKEGSAAVLEALVAWFFAHRRRTFPSMLVAQLFDPPLQKGCRTRHHHPITPQPTPAVSARSAGNGPTALITTVSKPDSFVSINPVIENQNTDEQQRTVSIHPAPPSRRRRPRKQRSASSTLTPVLVEDSGPAALDATVSKMDSAGVVNSLPVNMEIETAINNGKTVEGVTEPPVETFGPLTDKCGLSANSGAEFCIDSPEVVSSESVGSETVCIISKDSENVHFETVSLELGSSEHADPDDVLAQSGHMEMEVLPRASPEAELEASAASGPQVFVEPAVSFSSSPPFMIAISPSLQLAAQLVTQSSSVPPSTSNALPPHPPPAAAVSPSSPPGEQLSERGEPAPQPEEQLSERGEPAPGSPRRSRRSSSASGGSPRRGARAGEPAPQPEEQLSEREEPAPPAAESCEPEQELREREVPERPAEEPCEPEQEPGEWEEELSELERLSEQLGMPVEPAPLPEELGEPVEPAPLPEERPLSREGLGRPEGPARPEPEVGAQDASPRRPRPVRPPRRPRPARRGSWAFQLCRPPELQRRRHPVRGRPPEMQHRRHWISGRPPELFRCCYWTCGRPPEILRFHQ